MFSESFPFIYLHNHTPLRSTRAKSCFCPFLCLFPQVAARIKLTWRPWLEQTPEISHFITDILSTTTEPIALLITFRFQDSFEVTRPAPHADQTQEVHSAWKMQDERNSKIHSHVQQYQCQRLSEMRRLIKPEPVVDLSQSTFLYPCRNPLRNAWQWNDKRKQGNDDENQIKIKIQLVDGI